MVVARKLLLLSISALAIVLFAGCNASSPTSSVTADIVPDSQPGSDWTRAEAPGWSDQTGFSLMLPPGWTLTELQGVDSYVGEVTGHGVRLMFDYGWHSWGLNPDDEPEHEYIVHYEEIGGIEAKLLLPTSESTNDNASYGAATGVYFGDLNDGYALNLVGRGLTRGEQRVAVAIFRSVRALE